MAAVSSILICMSSVVCERNHPLSLQLLKPRFLQRAMSFDEAISALNQHLGRSGSSSTPHLPISSGQKLALRIARFQQVSRYIQALELEEPLSGLSIIHVAGTKGKGSTCAFTESILRSCGYSTGLFTSPHLIDIRERFRFNGNLVSKEVFAEHFWWCWHRLQAATSSDLPMPWFFCFLTVLALRMFTAEKVDVAIIEVGIGGLFDATNVVPHPRVCGIASLGLDHMEVLGDTLAEIAAQKAGIFKAGVPAFSVPQQPEAMDVLCEQARSLSVPFSVAPALEMYSPNSINLGLDGKHQRVNAALAVALCATWESQLCPHRVSMLEKGCLPDEYLHGLETTSWPGRGQVIHDVIHPYKLLKEAEDCHLNLGTLTFYLDGAHTPESLEACAKWFSSIAVTEGTSNNHDPGCYKANGNSCNGQLFRASTKANGNYCRVLLFSCMPKRDPEKLFPCLLRTCEDNGLHMDMALFVPTLSTTEAMDTRSVADIWAMAMEADPDLSWQKVLQQTWESHQILHHCGSGVLPVDGLTQLCEYLEEEKRAQLRRRCVLSHSSAILPSLPAALDWLRFWAQRAPLNLQVLVTGSLYLVGDLLKTCKECQVQDV